MKKFYLQVVFTFLFLLTASYASAQYTKIYSSYAGGGNWSNPLTWQISLPLPGGPPSPCDNCLIVINGNVVLDAPDPMEFTNTLGPNKIIISAGVSLDINVFVMAADLDIIVSDPGTLNVNNEVQMFGGNIQLNGYGSLLSVANLLAVPSTGTLFLGDPAGAGVYISRDGVIPMDPTSHYDAVLSLLGQYGSNLGVTYDFFAQYTINCDGNNGGSGACADPAVYGGAFLADTVIPPNDVFRFKSTTPLPVTLLKFLATPLNGKSVSVNWSTVQEINSDYFLVERSADATSWESLGQVPARGHSSGVVDYKYVDPAPPNSTNYYRLKMVDLDGKFKYSQVAKVNLDGKSAALTIYNNPFHDQVRIKINLISSEVLDLKLTDLTGRTHVQQTIKGQPGDNFVNLNPSLVGSGLYILTIKGQTYSQSAKLIRE